MKNDGVTARSIFNGKHLSKDFITPATTNLPGVAEVLEEIGQCEYLIVGDWRHYFHQFGLIDSVSEYFGLLEGGDAWVYSVLPMCWSWSPRLAQSASVTILLEAAIRAGIVSGAAYKRITRTRRVLCA